MIISEKQKLNVQMILSGCSQCQGFSGSSFIDCEVFVGSPLAGMGLRLFSADFWQESIFAYDCSQSFLYSLSDDIWLCLKNFSISDGMVLELQMNQLLDDA